MPDLPRRPQRPRMVAVPPDRPSPPQRPVNRPRHADREPPRPRRQPRRLRLDDEVHVIRLHRKMNHPKRIPARRPDRLPHGPEHPGPAQRWHIRPRPQRQVHRKSSLVPRPRPMGHRCPAPRDRRPPGPLSLAPPPGGPSEPKLAWSARRPHLNRAIIARPRANINAKRPSHTRYMDAGFGEGGFDVSVLGVGSASVRSAPIWLIDRPVQARPVSSLLFSSLLWSESAKTKKTAARLARRWVAENDQEERTNAAGGFRGCPGGLWEVPGLWTADCPLPVNLLVRTTSPPGGGGWAGVHCGACFRLRRR
jgi:hypothetical protein